MKVIILTFNVTKTQFAQTFRELAVSVVWVWFGNLQNSIVEESC